MSSLPGRTARCVALLLGLAPAAHAQSAAHAPSTASTAPGARELPASGHRSALADYRALRTDEPMLGWREANDRVGRLGGWRRYAREIGTAAPAAAALPAASTPAGKP